jgi:diguanylate cyclase (GGDEF)-like protein
MLLDTGESLLSADSEPGSLSSGGDDRLAQQIDATLSGGFRWLRFPRALERQFIEQYVHEWRRHEVFSAIVALILYDSFLVVDAQTIPDVLDLSIRVRLGIVSPLILFGAWIHWKGLPVRFRQAYMAFTSVACTASVIYFQAKTRSPQAAYYMFGVLPIIVYANVVQRIPFWTALAASGLTLIATVTGASHITSVPPEALTTFVQVAAVTLILTLIASYRLEHDLRDRFLLRLRDELLRSRERVLMAQLGHANRQLRQLSETDALTGIANRRSFEHQLAQCCQRARQTRAPLSLLLLDVDHFKQYNDFYGHPAGDQCLREVVTAMQSALRATGDVIARYGGEEFAAILPESSEAEALEIAERVRKAVLAAALPHEKSASAHCVTISVGAATLQGGDHRLSPESLIKIADAMLYQAKIAGRNRVRPSTAALTPTFSKVIETQL